MVLQAETRKGCEKGRGERCVRRGDEKEMGVQERSWTRDLYLFESAVMVLQEGFRRLLPVSHQKEESGDDACCYQQGYHYSCYHATIRGYRWIGIFKERGWEDGR
jgi:hypothetical protein